MWGMWGMCGHVWACVGMCGHVWACVACVGMWGMWGMWDMWDMWDMKKPCVCAWGSRMCDRFMAGTDIYSGVWMRGLSWEEPCISLRASS